MKKWKLIACPAIGVLLIGMYMTGYKIASDWEGEIITYGSGTDAEEANVQNEIIVKRTTEYVLETIDSKTGESTTENSLVPVEFIGLDREELIDFIEERREFFEGNNESALNVMLLSFSGERIVIRRSIKVEEETETYSFYISSNEPKYYIFLIDNTVKVYKSDKTTLYMETGIVADELDPAVVLELNLGVAVKNISELYRLLESYTS